MSELHKEPINLNFYKAREKCSHRSYLLPLFNHLTSLKVDVDQFLLDRGCSQTRDLSSKLTYLRENAWHLFKYRPQHLAPNASLEYYIRRHYLSHFTK